MALELLAQCSLDPRLRGDDGVAGMTGWREGSLRMADGWRLELCWSGVIRAFLLKVVYFVDFVLNLTAGRSDHDDITLFLADQGACNR